MFSSIEFWDARSTAQQNHGTTKKNHFDTHATQRSFSKLFAAFLQVVQITHEDRLFALGACISRFPSLHSIRLVIHLSW